MRDLSQNNSQSKNRSNFKINAGLFFLIISSALVYIFSANTMATTGFQIKRLSSQLTDLEEQHKKLELQNSTLQSVSTIQQKTASLNLVPSTNITYLKDDNVALK
jgi:cell division protein FtsL